MKTGNHKKLLTQIILRSWRIGVYKASSIILKIKDCDRTQAVVEDVVRRVVKSITILKNIGLLLVCVKGMVMNFQV
jgi:hypothetical protein